MEKYSLDELQKVYNNLSDEYTIYTKKEKIVLLNLLLKELKNISCHNSKGEVNCFYSAINCVYWHNCIDEIEYICNKLDMYSYVDESDKIQDYKYQGCPFVRLEDDVVKLIKKLNTRQIKSCFNK